MSRKGKGRRKIEMEKIQKLSNLLVTFSKRRFGVFKKASELSTLCGAEVAIVVFSPGGRKVFSFGHPNVETVLQRYISRRPPQMSGTQQLVEAQRNARVSDLNEQLTKVQEEIHMEMKRGQELDRIRKVSQAQNWWELPVEQLDLAQVRRLKEALLLLKQNVANQVEQLLVYAANISNNDPQFSVPSSSASNVVLPSDANNTGGFNSNFVPNYQHNRLGFGNGFF